MTTKQIIATLVISLLPFSFTQAQTKEEPTSPQVIRAVMSTAANGDQHGQFALGYWYLYGEGVDKNVDEAISWFQKSAIQGFRQAQTQLGHMYLLGRDVPQDIDKAAMWLTKASDQGDAHSQFWLANMYRKGQGFTQSNEEAIKLYRMSAEQGFAGSQGALGQFYLSGIGIGKDSKEAFKWFALAAEQGVPALQGFVPAQVNLGSAYAQGKLTPRNLVFSYGWFRIAELKGHKESKEHLEKVKPFLDENQLKLAEQSALEWIEKYN